HDDLVVREPPHESPTRGRSARRQGRSGGDGSVPHRPEHPIQVPDRHLLGRAGLLMRALLEHRRRLLQDERGIAMITALIAVLVTAMLGATVMELSLHTSQ